MQTCYFNRFCPGTQGLPEAFFCIFTRMARGLKNILFFLLFGVVAGTQVVKAFTVNSAPVARKEEGIHRSGKRPNAEAETYQLGLSASCSVSLVKFASRAEMQAACPLAIPAVLLQANYNKQSALLVKDYLLHIYPSHNFW